MGLFSKKNKSEKKARTEIEATLNLKAKIDPATREKLYENMIDKVLSRKKIGYLDGGGTLVDADGMICECDVELIYYSDCEQEFVELFKKIPCPKGSKLIYGHDGENEIPVGNLEGLGLYLNGTDLPDEVYQSCDINVLYEKLVVALKDDIAFFGNSRGAKETALFFYGDSFVQMKALIQPIVDTYPLCQKCRIVQEA